MSVLTSKQHSCSFKRVISKAFSLKLFVYDGLDEGFFVV